MRQCRDKKPMCDDVKTARALLSCPTGSRVGYHYCYTAPTYSFGGNQFLEFREEGGLVYRGECLEINQKKSLGLQECTRSSSHSSPTTGGQQPAHHVLLGLPRPALGRGPWHGPCQEQHLDLVRLSVV